MADFDQPIIIKKVKRGGHEHHGGAWKIAYADFVTAMMAFFLLLWLISMTSPEQKQGLADYFSPPNVSESTSGAGGLLNGTSPSEAGAKAAGASADVIANGSQDTVVKQPKGDDAQTTKDSQDDLKSKEDLAFHSAAVSIRQAWRAMPEITEIADNLLVEETEEGLNIQIVEQEGRPMFAEGSKYPLEPTRKAIAAIAPILQKLPNQIRISGHTAAGTDFPNPRYGSWDLSADRANVTRSILGEFGLSQDRIHSVVGRSTEEPLFPNDPYLAANERVKITVLHAAPPVPSNLKP
jgi:chemotaxis protein MotB